MRGVGQADRVCSLRCLLPVLQARTHQISTRSSMSSRSGAVQRRGGSGQLAAAGGAQHAPATAAAAAAGGLKTWHLWMLFGMGWPSILLFFLSTIPAFSSRAQGLLLTFGWLFCACWLVGAAAGILTDNKTKKQATVFTASYFTAGIGSAIGGVLSASFVLQNVSWLFILGCVGVAGAVLAVRSLDEGSSKAAAVPQGEGAAAGAAPAAGGTAEVGDLINLADD